MSVDDFHPRNMARNALKAGLELEQTRGHEPLRLRLHRERPTRTARPRAAQKRTTTRPSRPPRFGLSERPGPFLLEPGWPRRRLGRGELPGRDLRRHAPQGDLRDERYAADRAFLRRDASFRRGPLWSARHDRSRPTLRRRARWAERLSSLRRDAAPPRFLVSAHQGSGDSGAIPEPISSVVQVVKGWVDSLQGQSHERVFDVAGDAENGASVDPQTCRTDGPGRRERSAPSGRTPTSTRRQSAFYYVRVLENPTCQVEHAAVSGRGREPLRLVLPGAEPRTSRRRRPTSAAPRVTSTASAASIPRGAALLLAGPSRNAPGPRRSG